MTDTPDKYAGPGEAPHIYSPDIMAQGDCRICGHTAQAHELADTPAMYATAHDAEIADLHTCPICGNAPEIDYGLVGAPRELPFISCPTIMVRGDLSFSCPMYAEGVEAWDLLCEVAKNIKAK